MVVVGFSFLDDLHSLCMDNGIELHLSGVKFNTIGDVDIDCVNLIGVCD